MAEQNNDFLITASTANGGEFELLETGAYSGVCVGLIKKEFRKYQSDELEPKFQFVFQVVDGDVKHYLRTLPYRPVINDRSNLFNMLSSWVGISLEKASEGVDLGKLVGVKAQLVVDIQEREGKSYNVISNILKPKKNDPAAFVKDDKAPAWLNKGPFIACHWIDGLGFAEATENKAEVTDEDLVRMAEQPVAASSDDAEGLPF
jgi:hypothetical protein